MVNDKSGESAEVEEAKQEREPCGSMSVTPGVSVPKDSNIIGGSTSGEGSDIATASGPSDSGGG